MLAQTSASNEALGSWVVSAGFVIGCLLVLFQVLAFFATRREVAAIEDRLREHQEVHKQLWTKLGGQERGLRSEADIKIVRLEGRVDQMGADLASIKSQSSTHTSQLEQLNEDIKAMPSQIIAQLSNLGVLKRPDRS